MRKIRSDRGAAAVEFALVLPMLAMLTFGIIFFGYAFHLQTMLDNAARDAVRHFTLTDPAEASPYDAAVAAAATTLDATALDGNYTISISPAGDCTGTEIKTIAITSTKVLPLTGLFGWDVDLVGSGSMRCTG